MSANLEHLSVALVVDDDKLMLNSVVRALSRAGVREVRRAQSLSEARPQLDDAVELLVCDLCLGQESGLELLTLANRLPVPPATLAMTGNASREVVFDLAYSGVSAFLEKPFSPDEFERRVSGITKSAQELLARLARAYVGVYGVREAQRLVRYAMFQEALERTRGNRHAAARLLQVDRRAVQLMAAELRRESN